MDLADGISHLISILLVKKSYKYLFKSGKLKLSRKFRVDISECHEIIVPKKMLKSSKMIF